MKTLLITPPLTDWNAPYPAISYLAQTLRAAGHEVEQADLSIELIHHVYSTEGLRALAGELEKSPTRSASAGRFAAHFNEYLEKIPLVLTYLSGREPLLSHRICQPHFITPHLLEFRDLNYLYANLKLSHQIPIARALSASDGPFGTLGLQDRARALGTLLLKSVTRVIAENIDPHWGFASYGSSIDRGSSSLDAYLEVLARPQTLIDQWISRLTKERLLASEPTLVGVTIPFAGNVLGALQVAKAVRRYRRNCKIVFGGGFVNTQLRHLSTKNLFDWVDYITLDDGERPLMSILAELQKPAKERPLKLKRTMIRRHGSVTHVDSESLPTDFSMSESGFPDYSGLNLSRYLRVLDQMHPMHQIWTGSQWNKLTLAHGCYWRQCAFCDTHLDYVQRYESAPVERILDRIESLIQQTGIHGFHFVDEAISPAMARQLSQGLLRRRLTISWWGNVRLDRSFDIDLAHLMANAGCVAVTAGLESATDRLLKLMKKGTTSVDIAHVSHAFASARILVHAYLIYGFPTQTLQEAINDLEFVRQMFLGGQLASGVWHRFTATRTSDIGRRPEKFGITLAERNLEDFSNYVVNHDDPVAVPWAQVGEGLERALKNFLHRQGLRRSVRDWFSPELSVPDTNLSSDHVVRLIQKSQNIGGTAKTKVHHHAHRAESQIR